MRWEKLGQVFAPDHHRPWMVSHAANTVAELLHDDVFRIYFTCRNENNQSHIAYMDTDIRRPFRVEAIADSPLLAPGEIGGFDDSGVSLSCITQINGGKYLYYVGWNLGVTVPWRNSIGLAIWNDARQRFERYSRAPIADRCEADPFSLSYPFVLADGDLYRIYYGSNLKWGVNQKDMAHVIKYAESRDAIQWKRKGVVALSFKDDNEHALSRPFVLKENGIYRMWYSYRGESYRIGYAESRNGLTWERQDERVGIDVSESGWDSKMICYPFLFDHKGKRYLLYNGNGYGKTGFGLAVLDSDG